MRQQIYTLPAALREDGKEEEEDEDVEEEEKEAPVGSKRRRRRKGSSGEQSKNLNMVSASAHVLGDSFRTVFMLLAAMVSSVTGISVLRYLRCLWSHRRLDGDCDDHHHRHERCGRSCHVLLRTL